LWEADTLSGRKAQLVFIATVDRLPGIVAIRIPAATVAVATVTGPIEVLVASPPVTDDGTYIFAVA